MFRKPREPEQKPTREIPELTAKPQLDDARNEDELPQWVRKAQWTHIATAAPPVSLPSGYASWF